MKQAGALIGIFALMVFGSCMRNEVIYEPATFSVLPRAPVLYAVDTSVTGSYALRWTRSAEATGYSLEEDQSPLFTTATQIYSGPDTTYPVSGKSFGTTFSYRVAAVNNVGASVWSNTRTVAVVQAPPPVISVSPSLLDFGYVPVDSTRVKLLLVFNTGGVTLSGSCSVDNYLFFQILDSATIFVPPGLTQAVAIRFTPSANATYNGNLIIVSNDPVNTSLVVGLRGTSSTLSGIPDTIIALPPSDTSITVINGPGPDSSRLGFEVRDSLGRHIDLAHSSSVAFSMSKTPNTMNASFSYPSAQTDGSGRVFTTLIAGTVPGTVQYWATLRRNTDGAIIESVPVTIYIH